MILETKEVYGIALTRGFTYLSKESAPVKGVAPAIARARVVRPTLEPLQVSRRLLDLRLARVRVRVR